MSLLAEIFEHKSYSLTAERIRKDPRHPIVFTNGIFDLVHPGHMVVLERARRLAGKDGLVVVGINSDESARKLKGPDRPVLDVLSRGKILVNIRFVDYVMVFYEDTPAELISALRPDVVLKGGDYVGREIIAPGVARVETSDFDSEWSTSFIMHKIRNS